jgi:Domain of Unknown Function with PDB structure (DUF3857)/Domain of Unknown Function with PDB structure (DUF3858)/Transglutaminase-like superfamily
MIMDLEVTTDDDGHFEDHYKRIKIFSDEGRKYGDIEIPYDPSVYAVQDIRARTVRPDGSTQDFNGDIYEKTLVKIHGTKLLDKTFAIPGVEAGDIIEVSYRLKWKGGLPDYFLHPDQYIITGPITFPTVRWDVQPDLYTQHEEFTWRPIPRLGYYTHWLRLPSGVSPQKQADGSFKLVLDGVPALGKEPYMEPEDALAGYADIIYLLLPAGKGDATSRQFVQDYWKSRGKFFADAYEPFIGKGRKLKKEAAEIVGDNDPPLTQLQKLYDRAQQIRNLDFETSKTSKEEKAEDIKENKDAKDVLKHGYGYGFDINALFAALARGAGFDAHLVYVTDARSGPYDPLYVSWGQLNAGIVEVTVGDKEMFFDPATIHCPFGLLPWDEAGVGGILLDAQVGGIAVATPSPQASDASASRSADFHLKADGSLEGKLTVTYDKQEALQVRLNGNDQDDTARKKLLEDDVKAWLPGGAKVDLAGTPDWAGEGPLKTEYNVTIPHYATVAAGRLIFPMNVIDEDEANMFTASSRTHQVYFSYPYTETDDVHITVPNGYSIENVPAATKSLPAFGTYQVDYEKNGGTVRVQRQLVMGRRYISIDYYGALRSFFGTVRSADERMVVAEQTKTTASQ